MKTNVVEIVKWKSAPGVAAQIIMDAAFGLVPDLKSIGGFIDKTLYKMALKRDGRYRARF